MLSDEEIKELLSMHAHRLQSKRRKHKKQCPVCLTKFEAIAQAKYCSHACRTQAWRLRNPDYKPTRGKFKAGQRVKRYLDREEKAVEKVFSDLNLDKQIKRIER